MPDWLYDLIDYLPEWILLICSILLGTVIGASIFTLGLSLAAYVLLHA